MTSLLDKDCKTITELLTLKDASLSGSTMWHLCRWQGEALEAFHGCIAAAGHKTSKQYLPPCLVGSRAEGLHGPNSDADMLLIHRHGVVGTRRGDGVDIVTEAAETYPGYTKLRSVVDHVVGVKNGEFLDTNFLLPDEDLHRSGPAFCELASNYSQGDAFPGVRGLYYLPSCDQVLCFGCRDWPQQAGEWIHRSRPSGWPSQEMRAEIVQLGCGVVPVAHKLSRQPELEWRFSFTDAELVLIKSLDSSIKECYVQFKDVIKKIIIPHTFLSSYCLKTILLWTCERISPQVWKDKIDRGKGFTLLLDELVHCLARKCIPSYFIPTNNIIGHIDRLHVITLLQSLIASRRNLTMVILINMQNSVDVPLLEPDPDFKEEIKQSWSPLDGALLRPEQISRASINKCFQNIAFLKLTVGDYEGIVKSLRVLSVDFLKDMLQRVRTINWISESEMSEEAKEVFSDTSEVYWRADHIARIATVYSILAMQQVSTLQKVSEEFCSHAKALFEESLVLCPTLKSTAIRYGIFLLSLSEHESAIDVLQTAITTAEYNICNDSEEEEDDEEEDDYLVFLCCLDRVTALCDEIIHIELQSLFLVEVGETDLVSYLLVQCYVSTGQTEKANDLLPVYRSYLDQSPADDRAKYQLLGRCYMATGRYGEALEIFQTARDRMREKLECAETPELTYNASLIRFCGMMINGEIGECSMRGQIPGEEEEKEGGDREDIEDGESPPKKMKS